MSIHKLTAGSGYDYLTRQVAAMDATDKGHTGLGSYYTEKGEAPGRWVGSGIAGIDGLAVDDVVTAEQMEALFGSGHHPLAAERQARVFAELASEARTAVARDQASEADPRRRPRGRPRAGIRQAEADRRLRQAGRLGQPFKVHRDDASPFRIEVARRCADHNAAVGLPCDWPVPAGERARIRTQVAGEFFRAEHGRDPQDARELAATIARCSRPKTTAVAGYDLTFSPVKSFSVLWALADPATAAQLERAHHAAVADALGFLEDKALFTREGTHSVRQVDVRGLVATAFIHRDSRAGDPDLHTHVAVANKVQTLSGKWLAIDGRVLFKANVAISEVYNTALEAHCRELGLRFAARPDADARKRPVREIVGVNEALTRTFSKRRASVEQRRQLLAREFQQTHGRPPTAVEALKLAQQATLETREAKHSPRSLAEQRRAWHEEALATLGGQRQLTRMVRAVFNPTHTRPEKVTASWVAAATDRVLAALEDRRATWQEWHVRAEALRQVRGVDVTPEKVGALVDLIIDDVLEGRSVRLTRPVQEAGKDARGDWILEPVEPPPLRRSDGSSVYSVAGSALFTSARIMAAEQQLVATADRRDGYRVDPACVATALRASTAAGVTLNAGQATLVRRMATSGARLQLAIAPAGSGKTTAMRALAAAWTAGGGEVLGLAPSAAAAEQLATALGPHATTADTLAKLTSSLPPAQRSAGSGGGLPGWVAGVGPKSLVIIDEAGMADTLSLAAVVGFVTGRGGSVRLVGDDRQLAAIGAGGVLRDIQATHGALQLSELIRFTNSAEAAASLALREGKPEALGFYLDQQRVQIGDLATVTEDVFAAWTADRAAGLDSIMLAPTRELVAELNLRARTHRLRGPATSDGATSSRALTLADGNQASVGDLIITRSNNRRLRLSATDWVKNGDRWLVTEVHPDGGLSVQHRRHQRRVRLPADYVAEATELGYATTVHTAQGVTADTMHGLATGQESRQQLYTMLTRGRCGNHLYLQVVGDGDPHSVIRPEATHPLSATEQLEAMLARDDAPDSATSLARAQADLAPRLGEATARYLDSLYVAAETTTGYQTAGRLDQAAEQLVDALAEAPAWPALRAHLLLLAAAGDDPIGRLRAAASQGELDTARDPAAVLDWRLDETGLRGSIPGPLPWVPGIPESLAADAQWGDYLTGRATLVEALATRLREQQTADSSAVSGLGHRPGWLAHGMTSDPEILAEVEVWRAAMGVDPADRRPTGAPQLQKAAARWQRRLSTKIAGQHTPALDEWGPLLRTLDPRTGLDDFAPQLADRLAAMNRAGLPAARIAAQAAAEQQLPDDHPAAALWWRISARLTPGVAAQLDGEQPLGVDWEPQLVKVLGAHRVTRLQASPAWPALVAVLEQGIQRGWQLHDLLCHGPQPRTGDDDADTRNGPELDEEALDGHEVGAQGICHQGFENADECEAMVWRASLVLRPVPPDEDTGDQPEPDYEPGEAPPEDLWAAIEPASLDHLPAPSPPPTTRRSSTLRPGDVGRELAAAALRRELRPPLEPTDAEVNRLLDRAAAWDHAPVPRERMLHINALTQAWFESHLPGSWAPAYLAERFGTDPTDDPVFREDFRPGYAPAGWTHLVAHLRRQGVTEEEMVAVGVASSTRTGRLIDRFRDRVTFPISSPDGSEIFGFVGRRHPDLTDRDEHAGPKYLNTPATPLFCKGAQLFGVIDRHVATGAIPVLVEGPTDAIAVTLASAGTYLGVAALGTSMTEEHATQLATIAARAAREPIIATDADLPGRLAAERNYWLLAPHHLDPGYAALPEGADPAALLADHGPTAVVAILTGARPLGEHLIDERLGDLDPATAVDEAVAVIAGMPAHRWQSTTARLAQHTDTDPGDIAARLLAAVTRWETDPRRAAATGLANLTAVRARLETATPPPTREPSEPAWAVLADQLDPRLTTEPDWPAAALLLQQAHERGYDVAATLRALLDDEPLADERPATDLRYRLISRLDVTDHTGASSPDRPPLPSTTHPRRGSAPRR
jgi:DNA primase catalytic core